MDVTDVSDIALKKFKVGEHENMLLDGIFVLCSCHTGENYAKITCINTDCYDSVFFDYNSHLFNIVCTLYTEQNYMFYDKPLLGKDKHTGSVVC